MGLRNYSFRNSFKERLCQVRDAVQYATNHPYTALKESAYQSTVDFVQTSCPQAIPCRSPKKLLELSLSSVCKDGLMLEFGVFQGASINFIGKRFPNKTIHGFDSFEGLPEAWVSNPVGAFSLNGVMPRVRENVILHKGWFSDTIPGWKKHHPGEIAFMHVDCDIGSATQTIFDELGSQVGPGTVLLFDDYFNFPNWQQDGHGVLTQFVKDKGLKLDYLGYAYKELAVKISEA